MRKLALFILLLTSPVFAQVSPAPSSTGSINASGTTCATTNACVTLPMYATTGGVSVTVSGTFSATLQPEQSGDGVNWSSSGLATISAAGTTTYTTTAMIGFRIRASAYVSGTAVITITAGSQSSGSSGGGQNALGTAFYASNSCAGQTNCVQLVDDDATNNCGTSLTTWMTAINAYSGPGAVQVFINGSGTGKGYLFSTCNMIFNPTSLQATVYVNATLDAGTNTSANLLQFGNGTNGGIYRLIGGTYVGGASLTAAGIEVKNAVGSFTNQGSSFLNFGAGNATLGSCTNYAIQIDNFIYQGSVSDDTWEVNDATTGRCAFANVGTTVGESTIMWRNNLIQGKSGSSCASVGILDGGWYGEVLANNIGNISIPVWGQGGGHRIIGNELDTESCTSHGVNAVIHWGIPSSSANIDSWYIAGNVAQFGASHATNFFQLDGNSTGTISNVTLIGNGQQTGASPSTTALLVGGANPSCIVGTAGPVNFCTVYGNTNLSTSNIAPCLTAATGNGWMIGDVLGYCSVSTAGANVAATNLITVPAFGGGQTAMTGICSVTVTTQATTSGTVPQCVVSWTDGVSNTAESVIVTPVAAAGATGCSSTPAFAANPAVGYTCQGAIGPLYVKTGTTVTFSSTGYASVGATAMAALVFADLKLAQP